MKKIISILLLFSILLCAVSCAKPSADGEKNAEETTTNTTVRNNTPVKQPYEDIIKEYTNLLLKKIDGKEIAEPNGNANEIDVALYEIVRDCSDASTMGYATNDINDDGVDELVLLNKSNRLSALFTLKNDSPILLLNMDKLKASIASDGTVYANKYIKNKLHNVEYARFRNIKNNLSIRHKIVINGAKNMFHINLHCSSPVTGHINCYQLK